MKAKNFVLFLQLMLVFSDCIVMRQGRYYETPVQFIQLTNWLRLAYLRLFYIEIQSFSCLQREFKLALANASRHVLECYRRGN